MIVWRRMLLNLSMVGEKKLGDVAFEGGKIFFWNVFFRDED